MLVSHSVSGSNPPPPFSRLWGRVPWRARSLLASASLALLAEPLLPQAAWSQLLCKLPGPCDVTLAHLLQTPIIPVRSVALTAMPCQRLRKAGGMAGVRRS